VEEPPAEEEEEEAPREEPPTGEPERQVEAAEEPAAAEAAALPAAAATAAPVWGEPVEEEEALAALDDTASMAASPLEDAGGGGWSLEDAEPGGAAAGVVAEPEPEEPAAWGTPLEVEAPPETATAEPTPAAWIAEPATEPWTPEPEPAPGVWRSAPTAEWRVPAEEAPPPVAAPEPPAPAASETAEITELRARKTAGVRLPELPEPEAEPRHEAAPTQPWVLPRPEAVPPAEAGAGPAETVRVSSFGPEVQPPSGVEGPGWAFATTRLPVSVTDEALHEEARRLARLLVSEIKLYNEEQVEEGRRNRDLYERLKDDIDRSRQMYEERVEPRVLNSTDYFYQELVRILAAGDSKALGI
jgi:hypothetical protein